MSKITVTTIAGQTSGSDANKVKIESGDTLEVTSNATVGGTFSVTGVTGLDGNVNIGNNQDINMDNNAAGQIHIDGVGYNGAIALNTSGMNIYTNSASRPLIFGVNETEVCRITTGGLAIGGTGAANTLDDYEEGSFTPTLFGSTTGTGSTGSATGTGNYRKVGSICTIQVYFSNVTLSSQSGQLQFGALPFASIGAYGVGAPMMYGVDFPANSYVVGYISGTSVGMYSVTDNAGWGQVAVENQSGLYLTHALTYITT